MHLTVALVGNPNSGKTSLFNQLTGKNQSVGNWPGVTVEKKEGRYLKNDKITLVDLPGIYSLSPYSTEEMIARNYLINEKVDAIINIVDTTNLERNLYLTTQLLELNIPVVVALNMMDLVSKITHKEIDLIKLQTLFQTPLVPISALKRQGLVDLIKEVENTVSNPEIIKPLYHNDLEAALTQIKTILPKTYQPEDFLAIKFLENDSEIIDKYPLSKLQRQKIANLIIQLENEYEDDIESIIADQRYKYITSLCKNIIKKTEHSPLSHSDKIDKILTSRIFGFPFFILVMFSLYYVAVGPFGSFFTELLEDDLIPNFLNMTSTLLTNLNVSIWLKSLVVDGLLAGVGAVITFVPQIFILFFLISILEDSGYMARIAFILDRMFRKFGLSGKSFIPMLIGSGCSVPGIMATRTIESESDRRLTIILTPFIICSAKLPIFTLLISAFFPRQPWILTILYFTGIFLIILSGMILKRFKYFKGKVSPFVMELPAYRLPQLNNIFKRAFSQAKIFITQAGTVIFLVSGLIWFLSSFNFRFENVSADQSILAFLGQYLAFIFKPLGFGNWQISVALISGIMAKETIVATLAILLGLSENSSEFVTSLTTLISPLQAYSLMIFILFSVPCIATIAATKREMVSLRWTLFTITFQTSIAYLLAWLTYQVGSLLI